MSVATVTLTAATPVAFRAGRDTDAAETLEYVPGSTFRGALAAAHVLLRPEATEQFTSWFANEGIHFGNGYPCRDAITSVTDARPIPRTALCCKRFRGFLADTKLTSGSLRRMEFGIR